MSHHFHALPPGCCRRYLSGVLKLLPRLFSSGRCSVSLRAAVPTQPAVSCPSFLLILAFLHLLTKSSGFSFRGCATLRRESQLKWVRPSLRVVRRRQRLAGRAGTRRAWGLVPLSPCKETRTRDSTELDRSNEAEEPDQDNVNLYERRGQQGNQADERARPHRAGGWGLGDQRPPHCVLYVVCVVCVLCCVVCVCVLCVVCGVWCVCCVCCVLCVLLCVLLCAQGQQGFDNDFNWFTNSLYNTREVFFHQKKST